MGIKEFKQMTWEEKLKELEDWIIENKRMPTETRHNTKEKLHRVWLRHQEWNYYNNGDNLKYNNYRKIFDKFMEKIKIYKKDDYKLWDKNLTKLEEFILRKNRKPLDKPNGLNNLLEEGEKELAIWTSHQVKNCKDKIKKFQGTIYETKWNEFTNKYNKYFTSKNDSWINNYNDLIMFINSNNRRPLSMDKNIIEKIKSENNNIDIDSKEFTILIENERYLGKWLYHQISRYNKLNDNDIENDKETNLTITNKDFLDKWNELIINYSNLFLSNEEIWNIKYNNLINFIEKNKIKPSRSSKDNDEKTIANWINVIVSSV